MKIALTIWCVLLDVRAADAMSQVAVAMGVAAAIAAVYVVYRRRRPPFDALVDRGGMFTVKHELTGVIHGAKASGAIQLWVADMELPCCEHIRRALEARARHPIPAGYTFQPPQAWANVAQWLEKYQNWPRCPDPSSFVFSANVVASFANLMRVFTRESDGVVVMTPCYSPLQRAVNGCDRRLILHPLATDRMMKYDLDLPALSLTLASQKPAMLLLINPHNPSGRVWSSVELGALAALCAEHDVLVVSDEIWGDWCFESPSAAGFTPFARVGALQHCRHVTLSAPTKTFNLAGLHCSYLIVEDEQLRKAYMDYVEPATLHYGSAFATEALLSAFCTTSASWLAAAKSYVQDNASFVEQYLQQNALDEWMRPWPLAATYLLWLDCSGLAACLERHERRCALHTFFIDAGVVLSAGSEFDPTKASDKFMRMNIACSRGMLESALDRIRQAVHSLVESQCM